MKNNWNFENSYLKLPKIFYSNTRPDNFKDLKVVLKNEKLLKCLDINKSIFDKLIINSINIQNHNFFSQAYAGHQFGNFTILGDGRATFIGEHINNKNKRYDIQLKGSGKTPYSRNGDGKGTLKSMLREYIVSESMHNLNINTTRSLSIIKTGEKIFRNGYEEGGILVRVAKSHIRVGTFQLASLSKEKKDIEELTEYSIKRLYPEISQNDDRYLEFYKKVVEDQIKLIVEWQRVGFIHGVMNTDNMALSGETIDYGPCAFLDEYSPNKVFSSIDQNGRYAFNNQPRIALWNLARFGETILHLIDKNQKLAIKKIEKVLIFFEKKYKELWLQMMKDKLQINKIQQNDQKLISELLDLMHVFKLDYTDTFIEIENNQINKYDFMKSWFLKLEARRKLNENSKILKNKSNPRIIPRNHLVEKVLNEAEKENYINLNKLLKNLSDPYSDQISDEFKKKPTEEERIHQTFCGT
tara:strand:- start:13303 stop:14709 length:1407 start_codon:yes stop_codon:yes gene_type:complete